MKIRVVIEYDKVARTYAAYCPELPGCASCGDTESEVLRNVREAIGLYLEPSKIKLGRRARVVEVTV